MVISIADDVYEPTMVPNIIHALFFNGFFSQIAELIEIGLELSL